MLDRLKEVEKRYEELMARLVRKAHELRLDRGAVSRSLARDVTRVHSALCQVFLYNIVCFLVCVNYMAGELLDLLHRALVRIGREGDYLVLAELNFKL